MQAIEPFSEILSYRELLWTLTVKEIKVRYKQAVLGVAWAMFTPVAFMLIFTFVFNRVARIDTGDIPYAIFAYCGLLPWTFFAASLSAATQSLVKHHTLVSKVYFPREVFPLAAVFASLVDFLIGSVILVGLMVYYRGEVNVGPTAWLLPAILLAQILFTIGVGSLLAMGNLFYRDVKYIFEVVIVLWMFSTAVVYPIEVKSPALSKLLSLNPMTPIINSYRDILLKGSWPNWGELGIASAVALAAFFVGIFWFHSSEHLFAESI